MLKKLLAISFLVVHLLFVTAPAYAQDPNPVPTQEDEDSDSKNDPATTEAEKIIGPIGAGTAGERCQTDIKIDKSKIVDNIDFNIPFVSRRRERKFFEAFVNFFGGTEIILKEVETDLNESKGELCVDGSTPSTEDPEEIKKGNCQCIAKAGFAPETDFCEKLFVDTAKASKAQERSECKKCTKKGMWTAIGCVDYDFKAFLTNIVFKIGISLGGLVALGCIVYSSILLQISRGDAENIQHARELITSCILGLILIIFSVFILEFIGVSLLNLGELGAKIGS